MWIPEIIKLQYLNNKITYYFKRKLVSHKNLSWQEYFNDYNSVLKSILNKDKENYFSTKNFSQRENVESISINNYKGRLKRLQKNIQLIISELKNLDSFLNQSKKTKAEVKRNLISFRMVIPQKEKLKTREILIPLILFCFLLFIFVEYRNDGLIAGKTFLALISSFLTFIFSFSQFVGVIKLRIKRLYNSIIWLIIVSMLFYMSYIFSLDKNLIPLNMNSNLNLLKIMQFPLISYMFYHLSRVIHILLYQEENLFYKLSSSFPIDEIDDRGTLPTDKGYNLVHTIFGFVLFIIWTYYISIEI